MQALSQLSYTPTRVPDLGFVTGSLERTAETASHATRFSQAASNRK
jgi:hypothetical protein